MYAIRVIFSCNNVVLNKIFLKQNNYDIEYNFLVKVEADETGVTRMFKIRFEQVLVAADFLISTKSGQTVVMGASFVSFQYV